MAALLTFTTLCVLSLGENPGVLSLGENPGVCVATECAVPLAECLVNTVCRTWEGCVTGCGLGAALPCQIRCADLYHPTDATAAKIDAFSECAITNNHCVPQSGNASDCSPPANAASLPAFDAATLASVTNGTSTWFVTRGHNPLFDCFDCQVHNFSRIGGGGIGAAELSAPKTLKGDLAYLVKKDLACNSTEAAPCAYLPRLVHQSWAVDGANSAHLINHNNTAAEMHYADDWYVLASAPEKYVLVYYCGCNDAQCGYGGAVLYTKDSAGALSDADRAVLAAALVAADVGFTFDSMCAPNNVACS